MPQIRAAIAQADFMAFDCEMTGVELAGKNARRDPMDDVETYYQKVKAAASAFAVVQFGLATFTWNAEGGKYDCQVFNFFVFQRPIDKRWPDERCARVLDCCSRSC